MARKSAGGSKKSARTAASASRAGKAKPRARELELRHAPRQSRSKATFEQILDATAQLLEGKGLEGINTNAIARAAGINVATLYQYFPNKQAVLLALFQRFSTQRIDTGKSGVLGMGGSLDWQAKVGATVEGLFALRRTLPGTAALMQAMRVFPELRAYHRDTRAQIAQPLADEIAAAAKVPMEEALLVATCAVEAHVAMLDFWQIETGGRDERIQGQVQAMMTRYLAPYFEGAAGRGSRRNGNPTGT
jgi:AcrR family transcriptional regulator